MGRDFCVSYLNLDFDFFDHPKTRRLRAILGKGSETLILRLWAHCGKFHPKDGILQGYSLEELEEICGWTGTPGEAIDALVKVEMLEQCSSIPGAFQVHDWKEHQGHLEMLKARAKAAAAKRWAKTPNSDAQAMLKQCSSNASRGNGMVRKEGSTQERESEGKPKVPILEIKSRVNGLFHRSQLAPWGNDEEHYLVDVAKRPDCLSELDEIERFFKLGSHRPEKVSRLLLDWTGVLDRARNFEDNKARNTPFTPPQPKTIAEKELDAMLRRDGILQ